MNCLLTSFRARLAEEAYELAARTAREKAKVKASARAVAKQAKAARRAPIGPPSSDRRAEASQTMGAGL